jgi:hypothetical protein
LAPVALRAPSAKANTEQQITCLQGGAKSSHQKGPNQVDETKAQIAYANARYIYQQTIAALRFQTGQ